jgi:hypothetical protein
MRTESRRRVATCAEDAPKGGLPHFSHFRRAEIKTAIVVIHDGYSQIVEVERLNK